MFLFINLNQRPMNDFVMNEFRPKMPPFGIAYISAMLKTIGIQSVLHDDNLHEYDDEQFRDLIRNYDGEIQAVGLTSVSTTLNQLKRVAGISKEILPDVPIIVGGPHARLLPEEIMQHAEIDVVFTSEAELSIIDFAKGEKLLNIDGIMYRENGKIFNKRACSYIHNLDDIPFPDYELFNIADYHATKGITKRQPNAYIISSRGCPYKCTFCSSKTLNPTDKKVVRFRSPDNVLSEIEMLAKKYAVKELFFSDDMFTGNRKRLFDICEGIIKLNLDIIWVCMTHVNNIDREKLKVMKKAGCHQICYGVESGDPGIQKAINKNLNFQKVKEVVYLTQSEGIDARCSFMFGNQLETPETMQKTIDFAKEVGPDFASFNIATPFPGTYFRSWAIENAYLQNTNYEALDSTTYALVTPSLPHGTVEKYCNKAFRSFYYSPNYILRRLRHIRDSEDVIRYLKSAFYGIKALPNVLKAM